MNKFFEIANSVAKVHILKHGANFQLVLTDELTESYLVLISHPLLPSNIEEIISTRYMPAIIAEEYFHCRIYSIAAKLLAKLYPTKP